MKNYTITIDTGTTNTRVYLFNEKYEAVASAKSEIGVRITAIDGNNNRLKAAIKGCLEDVLKQADITYDDVKQVAASGMITSNVGLTEIPHVVARHLQRTLRRRQRVFLSRMYARSRSSLSRE